MRNLHIFVALVLPVLIRAQITVSTTPAYADQVWYRLNDDAVTARPLAEWDLAFEINGGFSAGVLVNTAKGMHCYRTPYAIADWSVMDTAGMALGWAQLHDCDTSWSVGALGHGISGEYDLGWGQYNMITHVVMGDSIYVLELADGTWKKFRMDALAGGIFTFTYADLDGTNEFSGALNKADHPDVNFCYWSMSTNDPIDREPPADDWDLLFTKYVTDIGTWYGVTGILQNKNVQVLQVNGLPPAEVVYDFSAPFTTLINSIGYDWKYYDMGTSAYIIDDSLTYFVKDVPGNVWKLVFAGFGGSANGDITFTKELVSAVGVPEMKVPGTFTVFPDPVSDGPVTLVLDHGGRNGTLSIIDLNGRVVQYEPSVLSDMSGRALLDVHSLAPGLYTLQVRSGDEILVARLSIQ